MGVMATSRRGLALLVGGLLLGTTTAFAHGLQGASTTRTDACPPGLGVNAPAPALIAKKLIARGTRGSVVLYGRLYASTTLPCRERQVGALVDPGYLMGRTVRRDLLPGQQLARSDLSRPGVDRGLTDRAECTGLAIAPVPVLIASKVIRRGTPGPVIQAERLAELQTYPCYWRRRGALASPDELFGHVAGRDVFVGQQLTRAQFR
jgi:flagella basal body P-ring formation protein FlgA